MHLIETVHEHEHEQEEPNINEINTITINHHIRVICEATFIYFCRIMVPEL